jgi:GAF domain-containing protein/HAMP domain-containing protein
MSMAKIARQRHVQPKPGSHHATTLLLLSMLPLLLMGSLGYLRGRALLSQQAFDLLNAAVGAQGQQLDAQISTGQLLLGRAAAEAEAASSLEVILSDLPPQDSEFLAARLQLFDSLQSINQPRPFFNQFLVVLPGGYVQISTRQEWEGAVLADPFYQGELAGKNAALALYQLPPLYDEAFIILSSIPVRDDQGQVAATLLGIAESPTIRAMIDSAVFYSTNHYFVTAEGEFVAANPYPNSLEKLIRLEPTEAQLRQIYMPLMDGTLRSVEELESFENRPVIAAYTWLPRLKTGWVAEVPQARVYGPVNSLLSFAVLLFVITGVLMTGALWLATRYLVRPLLHLNEVVQSFTEGDWTQRANVRRRDEVGLLAHAFNQLAEDMSDLHHSLETKVETRTRQISTAADVTQIAISSPTLHEMFERTLALVRERFDLAYAALYQMDEAGEHLILRQSQGPENMPSLPAGGRLPVDSATAVGRAAGSNRPQFEQIHPESTSGRSDLLPGATMEGCAVISVGIRVLAVLHVQDTRMGGLDEAALAELQTIASQLAPALQNFNLQEAAQINLQETRALYQAGRQIAQARDRSIVLEVVRHALRSVPYASALLVADGAGFRKTFERTPGSGLPERLALLPEAVAAALPADHALILTDFCTLPPLPEELIEFGQKMSCEAAAYLPILQGPHLQGMIILGLEEKEASKRLFTATTLQPYTNFTTLVNTTLEKIDAVQNIQKQAVEMHILDVITTAISVETELGELYRVLHQQLSTLMGEVDFFIAVYDKENELIHIPYMMEKGEHQQIDPFPLGEGLTSRLIQTRQPLLLAHEAKKRADALGAKVVKGYARSWLGVPMLLSGEPVGALVVQDLEREGRFTEDDQRLLTTLAGQVAVAVRNVALLASTRQQAESERLLFDISSKLRRTTDMERILQITAEELGKALRLRRTQIKVELAEGRVKEASTPDPNQLSKQTLAPPTSSRSGRRRNGDEAA